MGRIDKNIIIMNLNSKFDHLKHKMIEKTNPYLGSLRRHYLGGIQILPLSLTTVGLVVYIDGSTCHI